MGRRRAFQRTARVDAGLPAFPPTPFQKTFNRTVVRCPFSFSTVTKY